MTQKLVKLITCMDVHPRESWFVLKKNRHTGQIVYSLLPGDMALANTRFWDWCDQPVDVRSLDAQNAPGGLWLFADDSGKSAPLVENRYWYRSQKARRNLHKLQMQIFSPAITGIQHRQSRKLPADTISIYADSSRVFALTPRSLHIFDAHDLKQEPDEVPIPFENPTDVAVNRDLVFVVSDGSTVRCMSLSNRKEERMDGQISSKRARGIFTHAGGLFLLDDKSRLFCFEQGGCTQVTDQQPGISPIAKAHTVDRGKLILSDGSCLYHYEHKTRQMHRIYQSPSGQLKSFAISNSMVAIIDEGKIKWISLDHPNTVIAEFSAAGTHGPFGAPASIAADGSNRVFILDGNTLHSYQFFPSKNDKTAETKNMGNLFYMPHLPEGPFMLTDEAIGVLRHCQKDFPADARDLVLTFADKNQYLDDIPGKIALQQMLEFIGVQAFLADEQGYLAVYFYYAGNLFQVDNTYQATSCQSKTFASLDIGELECLLFPEGSAKEE